jgi:hypothetical protein
VHTILDCANPGSWRSWICQDAAIPQAERLRRRFHTVRAFHAARPIDKAQYYRRGIEPLKYAEWCELVDECFLSRIEDAALAAAVTRARDVQFDLIRDRRVHFCCDQRLLEERDGYTLLFGSLSLLAVAIQIDREFGTGFKDALRRRGEPIVFVCEIPTMMIDDDTLTRLVKALRDAVPPASLFDFHFDISHALPAKFITGHYTPRRVVDAVYGRHIEA